MNGANHAEDLIIGGYEFSVTGNISSGLPFSLSLQLVFGRHSGQRTLPTQRNRRIANPPVGLWYPGKGWGTFYQAANAWYPSSPIPASTTSAMFAATRNLDRISGTPIFRYPEELHGLGAVCHEVPHGCYERVQPHQPRQPRRQHSVRRHHHRRGSWTGTPSVGILSISQVLIAERSRNKTGGELRLPSFFSIADIIAAPEKADGELDF